MTLVGRGLAISDAASFPQSPRVRARQGGAYSVVSALESGGRPVGRVGAAPLARGVFFPSPRSSGGGARPQRARVGERRANV